MRDRRQPKSEPEPSPPVRQDVNDVERGSISASAVGAPPAYEDDPTTRSSFISDIAVKLAHAMTTLPFGIGEVFRTVNRKGGSVVAGELLIFVFTIGAGSVALAPIFAAGACLGNVTGSWVMRLQHSHEAYAFYGGSVQGNYAIAGALMAVPFITTHAILRLFIDNDDIFILYSVLHCLITPLPYSAAAGAIAAAIGAARGVDMQTSNSDKLDYCERGWHWLHHGAGLYSRFYIHTDLPLLGSCKGIKIFHVAAFESRNKAVGACLRTTRCVSTVYHNVWIEDTYHIAHTPLCSISIKVPNNESTPSITATIY